MNSKNRIINLLGILLFIFSSANAQDIHFSNFYNAPLILNPANTGNYIGNWRLISNYRQQGSSNIDVYKTSTLAFDMPFYYYRQMGSAGFIYINDNSADNTLLVNKIFLSLAHFIKISTKSYLHMGFQFGYVHKNNSSGNLSFPDQFDMSSGYFNSDMPTQEITEKQSFGYMDLNWGLIWSRKSGAFNSEIGVAMFHFNKPAESFNGQENELPPRYLSHAYFEINFENSMYLKPKLLYMYQNKAYEMLIGQDVGLRLKNDSFKDLNIGIFYRGGIYKNHDSFIAKVGVLYKTCSLSVSYDFGLTSKSTTYYTKSAFEISLQYTRPSTSLKNKTIPCETF